MFKNFPSRGRFWCHIFFKIQINESCELEDKYYVIFKILTSRFDKYQIATYDTLNIKV